MFPSLYQEGQTGFGYDVLLPFPVAPVFLQFKLADFMQRKSAAEWNLFGTSYYRMHLRAVRFSRQHELLLALENTGQRVFYAAPHFHQTGRLNQCYLRREVVAGSVFIPPSAIGDLPDDKDHYVAFLQDVAYFCSKKPRRLEYRVDGDHHAKLFAGLARTAEHKPDRRLFLSLLDDMQEALGRREVHDAVRQRIASPEFREEGSVVQMARMAAYFARLRFDAEIVLLGSDPNAPPSETIKPQ